MTIKMVILIFKKGGNNMGQFTDYSEMFLERKMADRVPANTLKAYEWAVKRLNAYFNTQSIGTIHQREVDGLKASCMDLAAASVNLILQTLLGILRLGQEYDAVEHLPVMHCLVPKMNERFLSNEESDRLLLVCRNPLRVMVSLALTTGLRRENIFRLRWDQIVNGVLTIKAKRGKILTIPLSPQMMNILDRHKKYLDKKGWGATEWVFPSPRNHYQPRSPMTDAGINRAFKWANLPYSGWHILRHTFATSFLRDVGNIRLLQSILGHSDLAQTARYAHVELGAKKEALDQHAIKSLPDAVVNPRRKRRSQARVDNP
jgi:integrase